jgi:LPXTG-motif cell wall-anchored protein
VFSESVSKAELLSQNTIYLVVAIAAVLTTVSGFFIYKKREDLKAKFENIRLFR